MKILFGTRIEDEDWQEQLITEQPDKIPNAWKWAEVNGFNRLRIADVDLTEKPNFKKAVQS